MSNYPKYRCPRTGIQFEGNLVPKELGIVPPPGPRPPAVLTNPRQGNADPYPEKHVQAGVTPQGIAFQGDEVVSRLDGQPPVGGSAHSFLTPGGSFSTRGGKVVLTNMTMDDVLSEWRSRAAAHRAARRRAAEGMRYDPVTDTYY
jgi:hypothetical protein